MAVKTKKKPLTRQQQLEVRQAIRETLETAKINADAVAKYLSHWFTSPVELLKEYLDGQPKPILVYPRGGMVNGKKVVGKVTGGVRRCTLEGCCGLKIGTRWPDGKMTWPCTEGMHLREDGQWQIR